MQVINIKSLSKVFNNKLVLDNINLDIYSKERVVIIGPSGSGKSTLLRCMNLLEVPSSGEVWFEDKRISDIDINLYGELKRLSSSTLKSKIKELDDKYDGNSSFLFNNPILSSNAKACSIASSLLSFFNFVGASIKLSSTFKLLKRLKC